MCVFAAGVVFISKEGKREDEDSPEISEAAGESPNGFLWETTALCIASSKRNKNTAHSVRK